MLPLNFLSTLLILLLAYTATVALINDPTSNLINQLHPLTTVQSSSSSSNESHRELKPDSTKSAKNDSKSKGAKNDDSKSAKNNIENTYFGKMEEMCKAEKAELADTKAELASLKVELAALKEEMSKLNEAANCPPAAVVPSTKPITPITKANYAFAETEVILVDYVQKIARGTCSEGVGILRHLKDAMDPEDRTILRPNFDTLYSFAVLDLESPATIVLPQTDRFQILQVVNQEHWTPLIADMPGRYELTQDNMGSRYVFAFVRTRVNMQDSSDLKAASAVQDQTLIEQAQKGEFVVSNQYDMDAILALRADYQKRMQPEGVTSEMAFGKKGEISDEMRNFGVAVGWGGLPKQGAVYPFLTIVNSTEPHVLVLKDVPNDPRAFWSVTVYDKDGFAVGERYNVNSAFAKGNTKGEYVIHLGGDPSQDNYLDIYPGWNALVRIFSPTEAYFNGSWTPPQFEPVK